MLRQAVRSLALRGAAAASRQGAPAAATGLDRHPAKPLFQRSFAAEAAQEEDVKPPIQVYGVAGKYAAALYVASVKTKVLGPVEGEILQLVQLATTNPDFANFLKDPSTPKEGRLKAIQDIFGEAGFTDITKNFLALLAEANRLKYLPKIAQAYEDLIRAHRGEVLATVTAALELTDSEVAELTDALKGQLKPGQTLKLDQKVDRSIIGGLVIDIGERHIDLSIESRIKQIEQVLEENV